jgi:hypothetical protein
VHDLGSITVRRLKELLEQPTGLPAAEQLLSLGGRELEDNALAGECGLKHGVEVRSLGPEISESVTPLSTSLRGSSKFKWRERPDCHQSATSSSGLRRLRTQLISWGAVPGAAVAG